MMNIASGVTLLSNTNHKITNMNNLFNLLINLISDCKNIDESKKIIQLVKLHMGMTFFENFRSYIMKKYPYSAEMVLLVNS